MADIENPTTAGDYLTIAVIVVITLLVGWALVVAAFSL